MTASRIVITAFVGLWSVCAFAQIPPAPTTNPNGPDQPGQTVEGNKGGPIDNRQNSGKGQNNTTTPEGTKTGDQTANPSDTPAGPDLVDDPNATPEQKASAEYSGPAVLSRGISASQPMNPKNTKFIPMVGVEYVVNSGLTGTALQSNGQLSNGTSSGVQLTYGLNGEKIYKRDIFSVNFTGNLYHYASQSGLDGSDDSLMLSWKHHMSRHLSFGVQVSAQQYDRNNLLLNGADYVNSGVGTTLVTATPATEAFDGRVFSLFTQGDITYQVNGRLSINLSGGGFETRRNTSALFGDTGFEAGADMAYRVTRHVTTGFYYGYTHFDFTGTYGSTDINTAGVTYSIAFNPTIQLITRLGASRLETTGITNVSLDPLLALLFGTSTTQAAVYAINYTPDLNIQLRKQVARQAISLAYARGVTPGNGVILTSVRQSATAGSTFQVGRFWNFNGTGGYDTLSGFGVTNQSYKSVFVGAGLTRRIVKNLNWHARFDFHHYLFDNTGFLRNSYVMATGLVWSPGDMLERVW